MELMGIGLFTSMISYLIFAQEQGTSQYKEVILPV